MQFLVKVYKKCGGLSGQPFLGDHVYQGDDQAEQLFVVAMLWVMGRGCRTQLRLCFIGLVMLTLDAVGVFPSLLILFSLTLV